MSLEGLVSSILVLLPNDRENGGFNCPAKVLPSERVAMEFDPQLMKNLSGLV